MTRPARLIVDPIACDGRGLCAELLPSLITLDDWGFPMVSGGVPADLAAEAAAVVRLCPRLALRLEHHVTEGPARAARRARHGRRLGTKVAALYAVWLAVSRSPRGRVKS